jgi:hypothetical protein
MISDCGKKSARIKLKASLKRASLMYDYIRIISTIIVQKNLRKWYATSVVLVRGAGDRKKVCTNPIPETRSLRCNPPLGLPPIWLLYQLAGKSSAMAHERST